MSVQDIILSIQFVRLYTYEVFSYKKGRIDFAIFIFVVFY